MNKKKLTLTALIMTTYFMVAGGPYGLEDIVATSGYRGAILILLLTPLLWSLPIALMVSELASAMPDEGGFYTWVKRGLGRFWGFQEAWLSLVGSIFDMAIYPVLFVGYLGHFWPVLAEGNNALLLGLGMICLCTIWNFFGTRAVGQGAVVLSVLLLGPFVVLVLYALYHHTSGGSKDIPIHNVDILAGVLIAMWNYMGWDNASTIANDVERPQRTYPLAMFGTVILVAVTYVLPIAAVAGTGIDPNSWSTGGWADIALRVFGKGSVGAVQSGWIEISRHLAGEGLAVAITIGGVIGAVGTFNALTMSLSRLPIVMAEDGFLPKIFMRRLKNGTPWVAILVCATCWALCLKLSFIELILLDVMITGLSILLEFAAFIALRLREPNMLRPYRVPGGLLGAIAISLPPLILLVLTCIRNRQEQFGPISSLTFGFLLIGLGMLVYFASDTFSKRKKLYSK